MKFYLSLTTGEGVLLDRFRLELPVDANPADKYVREDSEALGTTFCDEQLIDRLESAMRLALKVKIA